MISKKQTEKLQTLDLKAIFFDMDGVLYDSMPKHAAAWVHSFRSLGLDFDDYEAYMREGMTGASTINDVFMRQLGKTATEEECQHIYKEKSSYFESLGQALPIAGIKELLQYVQQQELDIYIVTGSGQASLLNKLNHTFPDVFHKEKMVTAFDVKKGKPDPEPYIMALKKGGYLANQAIVVENAPLGVRSAVGADIFTVAVNTGILRDEELIKEGADLLYHNMHDFLLDLPSIISLSTKLEKVG